MSQTIYQGPSEVIYGAPLDTEVQSTVHEGRRFLVVGQANRDRGEDEPDLVVLDEATVDVILAHFNPNKEPACADH